MNNIQNYGMANYQTNFQARVNKKAVTTTGDKWFDEMISRIETSKAKIDTLNENIKQNIEQNITELKTRMLVLKLIGDKKGAEECAQYIKECEKML